MEKKHLLKATKILGEIQLLDTELISIEKIANNIFDEKGLFDFAISFDKPKKGSVTDEDG